MRTVLAYAFLGASVAILLIVVVDKVAFGAEVPTKAVSAQMKGIIKEDWTDKQIVDAIYLAEGGDKAQYPYGIRSVHCDSRLQCKRCCEKTVRNNRGRFAKYTGKRNTTYIEYLADRYCPVGSRTATQAELNLNKNWIVNVTWFLKHPRQA